MELVEPVALAPWTARLELGFERRGERTVLASRRHEGPLVLQKPLYPEGDAVCHGIIVHPPAGIAGGDDLTLHAAAGRDAGVLLTTPGATKWYRTAGPWAASAIRFDVADGGALEWLPQETLVFNGAHAAMKTVVGLSGSARYIGWEILCLGRTGSGERFERGELRSSLEITRDGKPVFIESTHLAGGGALLASPAGLDGHPVAGTLVAACPEIAATHVAACRELAPARGEGAVTRLPGVLVARYLGSSGESARRWFAGLWAVLRPTLLQRAAAEPRIWRT